jgi:hypothetical protein
VFSLGSKNIGKKEPKKKKVEVSKDLQSVKKEKKKYE